MENQVKRPKIISKLPKDYFLYFPFGGLNSALFLDELRILELSQRIREKPDWHDKIKNKEILKKWKSEAKDQGLRSEVIKFAFEEVKYFATLRDGCIEPGPVYGSWVADGLINEELESKFIKIVEKLENVPERDYHPGSHNLVIDLVHPSLYCFVEHKSIIINEETIDEEYIPKPKGTIPKKVTIDFKDVTLPSCEYRWLPADVTCSYDGKITFDSYINNLHPKKFDYKIIAEILEQFIPLFNKTLNFIKFKRIPYIYEPDFNWYDDDYYLVDEYISADELLNKIINSSRKSHEIKPVPIPEFSKPPKQENLIDLKGKKLQVIVKLANIELTSEKPKYNGGSWHIEGIDQERIVAT